MVRAPLRENVFLPKCLHDMRPRVEHGNKAHINVTCFSKNDPFYIVFHFISSHQSKYQRYIQNSVKHLRWSSQKASSQMFASSTTEAKYCNKIKLQMQLVMNNFSLCFAMSRFLFTMSKVNSATNNEQLQHGVIFIKLTTEFRNIITSGFCNMRFLQCRTSEFCNQ